MKPLDQVISDLENQREAIDRALEALRSIQSTESPSVGQKRRGRPPGGKKTMSAEGRARIAEAQRKRWAAQKEAQAGSPKKRRGKRGISAAGRKRLAEAMRRRWAAKRAKKAV